MSKSLNLLCKNIQHYAANKSNNEIAKLAGVPQSTISRILSHETNPNLETVDKIADAFNVTAADMISEPNLDEVPADLLQLMRGQPPHVLDTIRTILINLGEKKTAKAN